MSPYCASRKFIGTPRLFPNNSRVLVDCVVTSGPIPSPPTTAILLMLVEPLMRDSLRNVSRAARSGRTPEMHGFRHRAAASTRFRRGPEAALGDGADRSRTDAACPRVR